MFYRLWVKISQKRGWLQTTNVNFVLQAVGQDITKTWQVEDNQYLVVQMNSNLIENEKYTLNTWFEGELAEDLGGIYRSTYENAEGKQMQVSV